MRIGRASSVAAAKAVSSSARLRTFWAIRVVGRSPVGWIDGNSSASMPLTCDWNGPDVTWSVSPGPVSSSIRWPPGSELTRSVRRRAGHGRRAVGLDLARHPVDEPDLEVGRGQAEAAVLGLEEDVGEDGQGASIGDRPAHDREAAGQVLLHDRELHVRSTPRAGRVREVAREGCAAQGSRLPRSRVSRCVRIFLDSSRLRHHHHHGVDRVDGRARRRSARPVDEPPSDRWTAAPASGTAAGGERWTDPPARRDRRRMRGPLQPTAGAPVVQHCIHIARPAARSCSGTRISTGSAAAWWTSRAPVGGRARLSRRRSARGPPRSRGAARRCRRTRG